MEENVNYSQLNNYLQKVYEVFKRFYKEELNKSSSINFEILLQKTYFDLGLEDNPFIKKALKNWFDKIYNLTGLTKILDTKELREVILHSPTTYQLNNFQESFDKPQTSEDYQLTLETLAFKNSTSWNLSNPFVSFFAEINKHHFRVTLTHQSLTPNKYSKAFIRKLTIDEFEVDDFISPNETECPSFLIKQLIRNKKNVLIAGETGSGKTTFISTLLEYTSKDDHIVIIEDTHEIIKNKNNYSFLLAGNQDNMSLKSYCSYSLRMSPDRIVLGEMRGAEAIPFVLAMNNGHKGLMSTIHAASGKDSLTRLSLLFSLFSENSSIKFSQILKLVCQNIDYVIHMKDRKVREIIKVLGSEEDVPYYETCYLKKS